MRRTRLRDNPCSIAKALDVVGDPWTMLILRDALLGVSRFDDFATRLGIPRATLTARLDHLCETGVFTKETYQESPARYDYALTEKGEGLRTVVVALLQWGDRWARDDDPPTHLVDDETGRRLDPVLVDRSSGTPLDELDVRAVGRVTEGIERRSSPPL
jgi:DNA-binding HxlR family transcriptional regulator